MKQHRAKRILAAAIIMVIIWKFCSCVPERDMGFELSLGKVMSSRIEYDRIKEDSVLIYRVWDLRYDTLEVRSHLSGIILAKGSLIYYFKR